MALHVQASFAAGELDPALRERTTLDKYSSGLATARNVLVAKTGRLVSRGSRQFLSNSYNSDGRKFIVYSPPYSGVVLEWGHLYVRVISISPSNIYGVPDAAVLGTYTHAWTESDLPNINFESTQSYVYAFCKGKVPLKLFPGPGGGFLTNIFAIPSPPPAVSITTSATGYNTEYVATLVVGGQESDWSAAVTSKLPIAAGEFATIDVDTGPLMTPAAVTEVRIYRRPQGSGAFGFVGATPAYTLVTGHIHFNFKDIGLDADYTHSPPTITAQVINRGSPFASPENFLSSTGVIYQQRLLLTDLSHPEAIIASRTGYQNNFYRDYPLSDDSSLVFKAGSSGFAQVLRMIESDGLIVFTTAGVFVHNGALTPDNLALEKKGNWVIDSALPPLSVPGGVLFLDSLTNTVRVLAYSTELATYTGAELSIFSDHLFLGRKIVSWAFQDGETPVLWAIFNDGQFASFTYEPTQQMRAWTRCDSVTNVEWVTGTGEQGTTVFIANVNGTRWMERTLPRYVSIQNILDNSEAAMGPVNAFMDSSHSWSLLLSMSLVDMYGVYVPYTGTLTVAPTVAGDWSQPLTLTSTGSAQALFQTTGYGAVGTVFKWFDPDDLTSVEMKVLSRTSDLIVTVQPTAPFNPIYAVNPRIYTTKQSITGLTHLEGQQVAVMVDGYVVSSPNNDIEQYPILTVLSGTVTLPTAIHGAIIHIGLPITADVETLDLETVEQRPIEIESKTVNKVYIKVHRSRGLFAGPTFALENSLGDMEELETKDVNYSQDAGGVVIGNRYTEPQTERCEITIKGDWDSNGRICIRQVDPVHFEILSIMPDVSDQRRRG